MTTRQSCGTQRKAENECAGCRAEAYTGSLAKPHSGTDCFSGIYHGKEILGAALRIMQCWIAINGMILKAAMQGG
jgi:hypothetical protein